MMSITQTTELEGRARRILDDAWVELRRGMWVAASLGETLARLPDLSENEARRRAAVAKGLLERIDALDVARLPHDLALSIRLVVFRARYWARESDWYWTVCDPIGVGFHGMFLPTAYCGGFLINFVHAQMGRFRFAEAGDYDRYLALVADYARLIHQMADRTEGQAERGMYMPKAQLLQARAFLTATKQAAVATLSVRPGRAVTGNSEAFLREVDARLSSGVGPAFDRAIAFLGQGYERHAPDRVGLGQYAGGSALYADLVKLHTTQDLTPEQVHARGLERMAQIASAMAEIRREVGFDGDGRAYLESLQRDPRWRAPTVEGVQAVFQRYIDRMRPRFDEFFRRRPVADYTIAPLPEALQLSMTFGYYDAPRPERPQGVYFFNAANLTQQALFTIGSLTYHELVPGHHLHLATQQENDALHPFRAHSFVNAYNEGWAEYAATLAGEAGMYEQPEERYGRLVMDAFLTSRLVVDTGMNALGWSLEQARDYMREHSGMAEAEILTETVRYSCDIPAQALAYKLGDTEILALRSRMQRALGDRFDLRDFHETALGAGALPLQDLAWHVDQQIECMQR